MDYILKLFLYARIKSIALIINYNMPEMKSRTGVWLFEEDALFNVDVIQLFNEYRVRGCPAEGALTPDDCNHDWAFA